MDPIELLTTRRSVTAKDLQEPGPDAEQLHDILRAGHRVPDHGKLGPWRFIVFQGRARHQFGEKLAAIYQHNEPAAKQALLNAQAGLLARAPVVIAVIAAPIGEHKIPVWEQHLSAGAACQNILNAATALGFGAQWLTEWYSYDAQVLVELGLRAGEQIAGFIYIGSFAEQPAERPRPALGERISYWTA